MVWGIPMHLWCGPVGHHGSKAMYHVGSSMHLWWGASWQCLYLWWGAGSSCPALPMCARAGSSCTYAYAYGGGHGSSCILFCAIMRGYTYAYSVLSLDMNVCHLYIDNCNNI